MRGLAGEHPVDSCCICRQNVLFCCFSLLPRPSGCISVNEPEIYRYHHPHCPVWKSRVCMLPVDYGGRKEACMHLTSPAAGILHGGAA